MALSTNEPRVASLFSMVLLKKYLPSFWPAMPKRAPSSRAKLSCAITTRPSISTWSTGRSITWISCFISAIFFGMSLIMSVLVRSSATRRPRGDRKPLSLPPLPAPPPMPLASVSALKICAALW